VLHRSTGDIRGEVQHPFESLGLVHCREEGALGTKKLAGQSHGAEGTAHHQDVAADFTPKHPRRFQNDRHPAGLAGIRHVKPGDIGWPFDRVTLHRRIHVGWKAQSRAQRFGLYVGVEQGEDRVRAVALQRCHLAPGQFVRVGQIAVERHAANARGVPENLGDDGNSVGSLEPNRGQDALQAGHGRAVLVSSRKRAASKASRPT
jgi:hypothetical protein